MRGPQHVVSRRNYWNHWTGSFVKSKQPTGDKPVPGQPAAAATLDLDSRQLKTKDKQTKKLKSSIGKIMKKWTLEACSPFMDLTIFPGQND